MGVGPGSEHPTSHGLFVAGWYPDTDVRMRFPIDPESFFVEDSVVPMGS